MQTKAIRGVRVVSDGTTLGTKVFDAKTGKAIIGVFKIDFTHRAGMPPSAVIHAFVDGIQLELDEVVVESVPRATLRQGGAIAHDSDCAVHNEPAMPAGPCDCGAAPSVTPADVEAAIASEHYFTGQDGTNGAHVRATGGDVDYSDCEPLCGVQFCALVLKNGHIVTGEALLQDLSKPDPERARASARRRAFDKAYDMVVYAERERLAAPPSTNLTPTDVRWAEDLIRQLPADHEGRNSWLLNFGSDAPDARPNASAEA